MASEIQTVEQLLQQGVDAFKTEYQHAPEVAGIAPGRVNLIGEHTDYNDGFVFPMVKIIYIYSLEVFIENELPKSNFYAGPTHGYHRSG